MTVDLATGSEHQTFMSGSESSVRQLRTLRGFTQAQVVAGTGIAEKTYRRIESGESVPRGKTAEALADFFGVSLDEIYGRDGGANAERLERDEGELAEADAISRALAVYPLGPDAERALRAQRWFGGLPSFEDLLSRARTLQAQEKGKAAEDRAPKVETKVPAGTGKLRRRP